MTPLEINLLGATTGFATAVWLILLVSQLRRGNYWMALAAALLVVANLVSTGTLYLRRSGQDVDLPHGATTAILIALIFLPALVHFIPWLRTQRLLKRR